jgi:hypothetical protein
LCQIYGPAVIRCDYKYQEIISLAVAIRAHQITLNSNRASGSSARHWSAADTRRPMCAQGYRAGPGYCSAPPWLSNWPRAMPCGNRPGTWREKYDPIREICRCRSLGKYPRAVLRVFTYIRVLPPDHRRPRKAAASPIIAPYPTGQGVRHSDVLRDPKVMRWKIAHRLVIAGLLPLAFPPGCSNGDQRAKAAPPPPAVTVVAVAAHDVRPSFTFTGRVQTRDKVDLRARVEGLLEKRLFNEGQDGRAICSS